MTNDETVYFLVGAERSGTTAVRLMLKHHPQISWHFEFEYAVDRMSDRTDWPDLQAYHEWLGVHRIFQDTNFKIDTNLDYPHLIRSFLEQYRQSHGRPIVGATVHRHFDRLLRIWPNAKFLHIIRDPRDVARSCIGMGWAGNVWCGVERWLEAEHTWHALRSKINADSFHDFRFEDVIQSPEKELTAICRFMNVDYSPLMLTYAEDTTYDQPDPSLTYQWKRKLSVREIELVESRVSKAITTYGYEKRFDDPKMPSWLARLLLKFQNRWARMAFHQRRFGIPLWLAMVLSNRTGPESLRRKIRTRAHAVTRSHLK